MVITAAPSKATSGLIMVPDRLHLINGNSTGLVTGSPALGPEQTLSSLLLVCSLPLSQLLCIHPNQGQCVKNELVLDVQVHRHVCAEAG